MKVSLFGKQKRVIYCTNDPTNTVDTLTVWARSEIYTLELECQRLWDDFVLIGQFIPCKLINLWDNNRYRFIVLLLFNWEI